MNKTIVVVPELAEQVASALNARVIWLHKEANAMEQDNHHEGAKEFRELASNLSTIFEIFLSGSVIIQYEPADRSR